MNKDHSPSFYTVRTIDSISQVDEQAWNFLFSQGENYAYPFVQHGFLQTLEQTDCTTVQTGWEPHHLIVYCDNRLVAALIMYKKSHSYGEYVFDWSWADAYQHSGQEYFPKLVSAIPFTPATGPRLGFCETLEATQKITIIVTINAYLEKIAKEKSYSSAHILFPESDLLSLLISEDKQHGWMMRTGCQFHWFNQNYADFDAFLASFSARKRKNIKKERAAVVAQNVRCVIKHAREITKEQWHVFFGLYHQTYLKRSGRYGYLTFEFFASLTEILPDQVIMCQAYENGSDEMIAAALYFKDDETLYGRYWGATKEVNGLHFEACYYQGIEYAISQGLARFDPGAQGEHKIQRGFVPIETASLHWIKEPAFQKGIAQFLQQEKEHVSEYNMDARTYLPFKEGERIPIVKVLTSTD